MNMIGKGNTADILDYGDNKICKLFVEGYPKNAVHKEINNAMIMNKFDLSIPACYGFIEMEGRFGIVYERVYGKTMLDQLSETSNLDGIVTSLVDLHKKIRTNHTSEVMDYKMFLRQCIEGKCKESDEILKEIELLPDGDYLCHGDYHPGNVMVDEEWKFIIIDFMNVCHGPWEYDVARSYYLMAYSQVPKEVANYEYILKNQKLLADCYLSKMKVSYSEISQYVDLIEKVRVYE